MHIQDALAAVYQALVTLSMIAAWTATKVDDAFVKVLQLTLENSELMQVVLDLIDQHPNPVPAAKGLRGHHTTHVEFTLLIEGEITEQHNELTTLVQEHCGGLAADDKTRQILAANGIDWDKWLKFLPMIIQILMMFKK
jgi:hypothetical protein